jgi:copper/silver efflux system protein
LTTALLGTPRSRTVRGVSYQSASFVYVIFNDGTDSNFARARVQEQLAQITRKLPTGVVPTLGPDGTGVGWVYQYVVEGNDRSLADLRSLQDWKLRNWLASADGVAEVASVGGYVKSYSVTVDPNRLRALGVTLTAVRDAAREP